MSIISVLMPVYNAGLYVAEATKSILAQTFRDFDFIIVDDGSTDNSLAILEQFAKIDSRIRLISRPNTGIVGALNDGLAVAHGDFIGRMDADDLCEPNRFELQLRRLRADDSLVALGSCATMIDPDGLPLGPATTLPLTHEEIEARHLAGVSSIFHPAVLMRSDVLRKLGGYREGFCPCEDFDLWLRLGEVGRLANLPEPLFTWRRTATGIVASQTARMRETISRVLADAWLRRKLPGEPPSPDVQPLSVPDLLKQWGWWALESGYRATARKYALKSVFAQPLDMASWRLLACAVRGRSSRS
jgi:glycosyltransferase involved in cell wall biosynthesis